MAKRTKKAAPDKGAATNKENLRKSRSILKNYFRIKAERANQKPKDFA